jgi:hypothetical protein
MCSPNLKNLQSKNEHIFHLKLRSFAPDVDLAGWQLWLMNIWQCNSILTLYSVNKSRNTARSVLQKLCNSNILDGISPSPLAITLSRILVCKPQSADCERIISAYNRLKTNLKCNLARQTISDYLYVYMNMPTLSEFDVRPAVLAWVNDKHRRCKDAPN